MGAAGAKKNNAGAENETVNINSTLIDEGEFEVYNTKSKSSSGFWKRANVEAVESGDGVLQFKYPDYEYEQVNNNTTDAKAKIKHGYVNTANGSMNGHWVGINWNNVNEVKGQTYEVKNLLKDLGFVWDGASKSWKRKK